MGKQALSHPKSKKRYNVSHFLTLRKKELGETKPSTPSHLAAKGVLNC